MASGPVALYPRASNSMRRRPFASRSTPGSNRIRHTASFKDRRGRPYATYTAFCKEPQPFGLGWGVEDIERIIGERRAIQAQERAQQAIPHLRNEEINEARTAGESLGGRGERNLVDNVREVSAEGGNSGNYLTARIARDRPDILDRMKAGEFSSIRKAAPRGGYRHSNEYPIPLTNPGGMSRLKLSIASVLSIPSAA